jgi:ribonuclease-3
MKNHEKLEARILYTFRDEHLLTEALTHSSYANERNDRSIKHNERLEFLGDSVLSIVVSDYLFMKYPDLPEGELTKVRAKVVCEATLADLAKSLDLGTFMAFGRGEAQTGGRSRASILADAFEALIAAIYLDGGMSKAREFILRLMDKKIMDAIMGKIFLDFKTSLQEVVQSMDIGAIRYDIVDAQGPDHKKTFFAEVSVGDQMLGKGQGGSKKEAEQNAAQEALGRVNADDKSHHSPVHTP